MQNTIISPINQTEKHSELSNKYSLINTRRLLDIAESQGFKTAQTKFPKGKNSAHALHIVRLDLPGYENIQVKEYKPQVIIQNAHDGTSSIRIMAGVFRLVCSNGLVAGDTSLNIRLRHVGLKQEMVEEAFQIAAKQVHGMADRVEAFKARTMSNEAILHMIEKALVVRAKASGLSETETNSLLTYRDGANTLLMNRVRRGADRGTGLWEVFNRVQENSVRNSGLVYKGDDDQYHRLYSVNGIQANTKLNQELWELAESMVA
jgi:hypothetical protein